MVTLSQDLPANQLVVDGNTLYLSNYGNCSSGSSPVCNGGGILAMDIPSKNLTTLVSMSDVAPTLTYSSLGSMIADGPWLYWQVTEEKAMKMDIYRMPATGGAPLLLQSVAYSGSDLLGIDDKYLYFISQQISRIAK